MKRCLCRSSKLQNESNKFTHDIFSISDHFTFVLKCKQGCQGQLNRIGDEVIENMFPFMYFYMMFAYYKGKFDLSQNWLRNEIMKDN